MPRRKGNRKRRAKTKEPFPEHPADKLIFQRVDATREMHTRLVAEHAQILSKLTGLVSDMMEMKLLIPEPPEIEIPSLIDDLTLERVDAIHTTLEAELGKHLRILSSLTDVVSDMSNMKRLITGSPSILDIKEIEEEIMIRLPVKSLVRFRCVSRSWKSSIDSSRFIRAHKNQPQHLLVQYQESEDDEKYVSFADNDSFPHRRTFPELPRSIRRPCLVGSSYGLLCLYYYDREGRGQKRAVIWNPCIRKSHVPPPPHKKFCDDTVIGFGVCPVTVDPTIVYISPPQATSWRVEVYKLSCGRYRKLSRNLPSISIRIKDRTSQVVIGGLIYWCAQVDPPPEDAATRRNLIISFDITNETFQEVDLPYHLPYFHPSHKFSLSKLRESLVILEYSENHDSCGVWKMMDNRLFTKLFTINPPPESFMTSTVGFRNTGTPIMAVEAFKLFRSSQLVAYDDDHPNSKKRMLLSHADTYSMESYMETLLLIGRSNCISTSF